jgi:hypothetical protein
MLARRVDAERAGRRATGGDPQLAVDVAEVRVDGLGGHEQRLGDLVVGQALRRQPRDP